MKYGIGLPLSWTMNLASIVAVLGRLLLLSSL
jgi:hypothetical protein